MAQPTTTFLDELMAAARGCVALLLGQHGASSYFEFSQRGLVGSFIAVVIAIGVQALGPQMFGEATTSGMSISVLLLSAIVVAIQFGVGWLVLRQLGRSDGFVPFMVVQNWGTLFQVILAEAITAIFGPPITIEGDLAQLTSGSVPLMVLAIMVIIVAVNMARLIITLRPLHVALFVGAQFGATLAIPPLLGALL